ncbi:acyl-CoA synthetase [Prescottella agglutinans]|uniref:Long-chain acyl-CoA synthetase n=1 Tax=Prescottella agglutinans TaxID=1644129 RepID=A0ABT6M9E8_9NOCA|nr:acyl-CoA synthetase [Prescottella agglutinans]MDH6280939.1 long-chain acyl-CoA synthetase [Prescottella agglutinans]
MYPGIHAVSSPERPAVIMATTGEVVTYLELEDRSNRLAQQWYSLGLRPGDHVAILAENHPRYMEVYWAAVRSGLYITAVNWHLTANDAAYIVTDCRASVLVTTHKLATLASAVVGELTVRPHLFMMDGVVDGFESFERSMAQFDADPLAEQPRGDMMLYSSGTTGRPKGIRRPLTGMTIDDPRGMTVGHYAKTLMGITDRSTYLVPAPMYHSAALQWSAGAQSLGATVVLMARFDARDFLAAIENHAVTHAQVVPTMMVRLLKLPDTERDSFDLSSLQDLMHSAAPCPPSVKHATIDWLGPIVSEMYSGTEGMGMTFLTANEWLAHPGSVGRAVIGTPHICDDNGRSVPCREVGTVYFERDTVAFEYHNAAEKTADARHPNNPHWSTVGDVGYLDEDGYLYLTDRKSFMIISGGVNIYPAEIESCLSAHPDVADVAVFGLPDPEMGEFVHAVVELDPGVATDGSTTDALREHVRAHLAGYKVPRTIEFCDRLPRLDTGKVKKHELRDAALRALA